MAFLLYCGNVRVASSVLVERSKRNYQHEGPFLQINGPVEDVHDVLKMHGYRLATPEEQYEYYNRKNKIIKE